MFLLKGAQDKTQNVDLVLPQGVALTVPLGDDAAAWLLLSGLGGLGLMGRRRKAI